MPGGRALPAVASCPLNNLEMPPRVEPTTTRTAMEDPALDTVVPDDPTKPYDMRDVIWLIVDDGEFFEVHEHYAQNIVIGFARLDGRPVGDRRQPAARSWPACSTSTRR